MAGVLCKVKQGNERNVLRGDDLEIVSFLAKLRRAGSLKKKKKVGNYLVTHPAKTSDLKKKLDLYDFFC